MVLTLSFRVSLFLYLRWRSRELRTGLTLWEDENGEYPHQSFTVIHSIGHFKHNSREKKRF